MTWGNQLLCLGGFLNHNMGVDVRMWGVVNIWLFTPQSSCWKQGMAVFVSGQHKPLPIYIWLCSSWPYTLNRYTYEMSEAMTNSVCCLVRNFPSLAARGQRSQWICPVYIYDFKCLLLYRINISAVIERRGFLGFIQKDTSWYWWFFLFQKCAVGGIAEWQTTTK